VKTVVVHIFQVLLAVAIPLSAFTTGLGWRAGSRFISGAHAGLVLRALLAILIAVPLWALATVEVLPLPREVRAGIFVAVMAVGIGPAAAMKRMAPGSPAGQFALELNALVMAISIVFIPAAVALVGQLYHRHLVLGAGAVAKVVLGKALVPLIAGAIVAQVWPAFAGAARRYLAPLVNAVLALVLVFALLATWRNLLTPGAPGWLACLLVALGAVIIGHAAGGPDAGTRGAVASASTLRFPALALTLATVTVDPKRIVPVVLAYVIAALVVVGGYGLVVKAGAGRRRGAMPPGVVGPARSL
jgi:predicted Na+-dependent transporter